MAQRHLDPTDHPTDHPTNPTAAAGPPRPAGARGETGPDLGAAPDARAGVRSGGARAGAGTVPDSPPPGAASGTTHAGTRTGSGTTHAGTHTGSDGTQARADSGTTHAGAGTGADTNALADYLRAQATEFLRALRRHRESGAGAGASGVGAGAGVGGQGRTAPPADDVDAVRALRRAARRISGTLHTFQPLLDASWAEEMRPELAWLSGTLALEHAYASRLERLLQALHRLSGSSAFPAPRPVGRATAATTAATAATVPTGVPAPVRPASPDRGNLTVGAAKAGALLDRQLTLARTRAHSTALQALGSSRFHAVADKVALLASEVPLRVTARPNRGAAPEATPSDLRPLAAAAEERLADAVTALPLVAAGSPYNAQALVHGLSPDPAPHPQDAPWHQVRLLLRLHRYALEALAGADAASAGDSGDAVDVRLLAAGEALDRHRDASEAAAAAAQAARTPRIAPATAYALGVLHADQRHEVEAARYAFQHSWRKEPIRLP
ncbi:CHAD domain-containing protein [Streptomyces coelicoflavus]|uniref:CHAD domain-containing protein n=1 Tax=Streptomyces coelicoflavus TaxID=285562 RepID=UPI003A8A3E42